LIVFDVFVSKQLYPGSYPRSGDGYACIPSTARPANHVVGGGYLAPGTHFNLNKKIKIKYSTARPANDVVGGGFLAPGSHSQKYSL
jgi:hypothetical protein